MEFQCNKIIHLLILLFYRKDSQLHALYGWLLQLHYLSIILLIWPFSIKIFLLSDPLLCLAHQKIKYKVRRLKHYLHITFFYFPLKVGLLYDLYIQLITSFIKNNWQIHPIQHLLILSFYQISINALLVSNSSIGNQIMGRSLHL